MGSKNVTSSYWYKLIAHLGLCKGPIDWWGELRGGDRVAWTGRQTTSGIVNVYAPELYGGEKAEGGIDGQFELMMGESDQGPNAYLAQHIGAAQPGYRGRATIVLRGAKIGAGNPYPKTLYFKLCRILKGWDDDVCWYPEKAPVPVREGTYTPGGSTPGTELLVTGDFAVGDDHWAAATRADSSTWLPLAASSGADFIAQGAPAYWRVSPEQDYWSVLGPSNTTRYSDDDRATFLPGTVEGFVGPTFGATQHVGGPMGFLARSASNQLALSNLPPTTYTVLDGVGAYFISYSGQAAGGYYYLQQTYSLVRTQDFITYDTLYTSDNNYDGYLLHAEVVFFDGAYYATRSQQYVYLNRKHQLVRSVNGRFDEDVEVLIDLPATTGKLSYLQVCGDVLVVYRGGGYIYCSIDGFTEARDVGLASPETYSTSDELWIQVGDRKLASNKDGRLFVLGTEDGEVAYTDNFETFTIASTGQSGASAICGPGAGDGSVTPGTDDYVYMNPAHILYDSITSRRENGGMGEPIGRIDNASFTKAADRLYDEGFGICCTWYGGESTEQFQQRILNVCGGSLSQSRRDGKFYLDLLREVEDIDALPVITDDDITDWEAEPAVPPESINQIQIKWFDPETREQRITAPIQSLGAIQDAGGLFADIREYNEIPYEALANRVAQRDLNSVSSALWKITLSARRRSYDLRPGMQLRLMCPNRGFADMIVVIGDIDYGRIGEEEVRIIALQDVFALPEVSFVKPQGSLDDNPAPGDDDDNKTEAVIEAPYFQVISALTPSEYTDIVDETSGFLLTAKSAPPRGVNYRIYTKQGADEYATTANGDFCPSAKAVSDVPPLMEVDIAINSESLMDRVVVGDWALWDGEIVRVDAVAPGLVSLGRGCADTLPRKHLAGSTILFVGEWAGADEREYVDGEEVNVKLPAAGYGQGQALADATEHTLVFASRQARPYPPADLKINGVSIFALSGGTGGGGGGSPPGPVPTAPPATSVNGVPASQVPGPGGGYPDDGPPMFPPPPTFGGDVAEGGDFSDPTSLAKWRNRDGTALSPAWGLLDDQLHLHASNGTYAAYNYATRFEAPHMPFPRHTITVTAPVASDPSVQTMVGIAYGLYGVGYMPTYESLSGPSLETGLVTHVFTHVVRNAGAGQGFAGQYPTINYMPVVKHIINGGLSNARVGNVTMTVDEFIPPVTAEAPAHLALDAGLTGWSLWPDPLDTNPYVADVSVSGGVAVFDFVHEFGAFRYLICEDPLVFADEMHKYVRIRGKVWCDDDSTAGTSMGTYTAGGVTFGLAYKLLDGTYTVSVGGRFERGDFTEREVWAEVGISAGLGISVHLCILAQAAPGKTCKVKDLECDSTDDAYPPEA